MKSRYIALQKKFTFILILIIIISFSACGYSDKYQSDFFAMDTRMSLTAYGKNAENAVKSAEAEIARLDSLLSVSSKSGDIYNLNANKSIEARSDTVAVISRALEISAMTGGDFDITVYPLVSAWGFYADTQNKVPSTEETDKAIALVGYDKINLSGNNISLSDGASVDAGGIAKGYASAKIAEIFKQSGVDSAIISLGGNVRTVGTKPDGSLWTVAIADPDDPSGIIGTVKTHDNAIITSGGYQRYFEKDGKVYHHIIDPKTGYPAQNGLKSTTVISQDDTLADALSTALFVKGESEAIEFCKENSDLFDAILVTDEGKILITPNLKNCFSSDREFEVMDF